jgi:hypothetical protein
MFGSIGAPELIVILVIGLFYAVPIAAAVWVIVTLHRLRAGQQAIGTRLEAIERSLQRR